MKKVYAIVAGNPLDVLAAEAPMMVCGSLDDAKDLVDMWGEDYEILEVPYLEKSKEYEEPSYPVYKRSTDVEPMPFVGKPASVKNAFSKVPMDEVGMI